MFGLTRPMALKLARTPFNAIRTFIPNRTGMLDPSSDPAALTADQTPVVYEPLPPKRNGQSVMTYLHGKLLRKYDPTGKRRALVDQTKGLRSGDIIKVTYSDRSSVIGRIIAIKRSVNSVGTNLLLRNKINRLGCEVRIPLFNPNIRNIELLHKPEKYLPRRKHYYIRNTKYDVGDLEVFLRNEKKKAEASSS